MLVIVNYLLVVNIYNFSYLEYILDCKVKGINSVVVILGSCCSNEEFIRKVRDFIEFIVLCS